MSLQYSTLLYLPWLLVLLIGTSNGFTPLQPWTTSVTFRNSKTITPPTPITSTTTTTTSAVSRLEKTRLNVLLDVPDNFFAFTFPVLGIILSISKSFSRLRMEERAWEQRLEEARERRLREDPTLTEIDLRRKEAAFEWSAYGKPSNNDDDNDNNDQTERGREQQGRGRRVKVMDRDEKSTESQNQYRMSDEEISLFEMEYGIEYDPYYDDPYTVDELPDDIPFVVDRKYGDRIYENGEIFYKDKDTGLFYRQGAKPRNLSFWK